MPPKRHSYHETDQVNFSNINNMYHDEKLVEINQFIYAQVSATSTCENFSMYCSKLYRFIFQLRSTSKLMSVNFLPPLNEDQNRYQLILHIHQHTLVIISFYILITTRNSCYKLHTI